MPSLPELQRAQDLARMRQMAVWERLRAQLRFARFLVTRHPEQSSVFAPALDEAQRIAAAGLAAPSPDLPALAVAVEEALAPFTGAAAGYTVYLAGHAHIDMNWMWSWPETVSVTLDTFRTVLDLMEEFPEFCFSQSQASVYRIVEEHAPEMLAEIAGRVREGRWEVTASHWVEGDKNIAGGESLCRHLLYTRRYLLGLFGLRPERVAIDWSPDTFGHAATVPSYLAQGGVRYLFLHRPGTQQQPVPEAFWWEAQDGSRVLVHNAQRRAYNCTVDPQTVLDAIEPAAAESRLPFALVVYGVGDHGGGPTRRDLLLRREMASWPVFPRLRMAPAQEYFRRLEREGTELPLLRGELNYEFAGCYTTQTLIKRANCLGERRLAEAETAAAFDTLARGAAYPGAAFEANWRRVLFSHFHDILPGSGVHDTRTYTHGLFQETMAATVAIGTRALRGVAGLVDTSRLAGRASGCTEPPAFLSSGQGAGAGIAAAEGRFSLCAAHGPSPVRPFVVFNLTPLPRRETVVFTIWDREPWGTPARFHDRTFEAVAADGGTRPVQVIEKGHAWGHQNMALAVPVEVPAFGYATVVLRETLTPAAAEPGAWTAAAPHHCAYATRERAPLGIENALVRVSFDPRTGRIVSFFDKRAGIEFVDAAAGGLGLEYSVERPHGMTAWNIEHAGPPEQPALRSLRETRRGPYSAAIEAVYAVRESTVRAVYRLDQDDPRLHVAFDVDWFQRGTPESGVPNLRLALPLALAEASARYEIPFGAVDRETPPDQEVPALRWARIAGRSGDAPASLLLVNDCKHGHALAGSTLRVNLIRSSYDPDPLPEIGRHAMAFALLTSAGDLSAAEATRQAQTFVSPLLPVATGGHGGRLAPSGSLLRLQTEGEVVVSGLKMAEKGDGLVVRLYNAGGEPASATVATDPAMGHVSEARFVDLMERASRREGPPRVSRRGASFEVPAFGLASVWLRVRGATRSRR